MFSYYLETSARRRAEQLSTRVPYCYRCSVIRVALMLTRNQPFTLSCVLCSVPSPHPQQSEHREDWQQRPSLSLCLILWPSVHFTCLDFLVPSCANDVYCSSTWWYLCVLRPDAQIPTTCLLRFGHVPVFNDVLYCQIKGNMSKNSSTDSSVSCFVSWPLQKAATG